MSRDERLEQLCRPTRKTRILTDLGTFTRTPDIVVFQNFQLNGENKATVTLLNTHKVYYIKSYL